MEDLLRQIGRTLKLDNQHRVNLGSELGDQKYWYLYFDLSRPERATFDEGCAEYEAGAGALRASVQCCVTPLEGAAAALVTVKNTQAEDLSIELVSFLEPALGTLKNDLAHPNFRDLFVTVERVSARAKKQHQILRVLPGVLPSACISGTGSLAVIRVHSGFDRHIATSSAVSAQYI